MPIRSPNPAYANPVPIGQPQEKMGINRVFAAITPSGKEFRPTPPGCLPPSSQRIGAAPTREWRFLRHQLPCRPALHPQRPEWNVIHRISNQRKAGFRRRQQRDAPNPVALHRTLRQCAGRAAVCYSSTVCVRHTPWRVAPLQKRGRCVAPAGW